MPYVQRNSSGQVIGIFVQPQPDLATEYLEDEHQDLPGATHAPEAAAPQGRGIAARIGGYLRRQRPSSN